MPDSFLDKIGNVVLALMLMAFFGLIGSFFGVIGLVGGVAIGIVLALGSIRHSESEERDRRSGSSSEV